MDVVRDGCQYSHAGKFAHAHEYTAARTSRAPDALFLHGDPELFTCTLCAKIKCWTY